jgi:hypothetical protein
MNSVNNIVAAIICVVVDSHSPKNSHIDASFGIDRRLEKGKRPLPHDVIMLVFYVSIFVILKQKHLFKFASNQQFNCDLKKKTCFGMNGLTNVFAACAILLRPLLITFANEQHETSKKNDRGVCIQGG